MAELIADLRKAILDGEEDLAITAAKACLDAGIPAKEILATSVIAGIEDAGKLWEKNQYFLPEVILSAEAFKAAMKEVEPHLTAEGLPSQGKVIIGTIEGDMHDLGKAIVVAMLAGAGYEVVDLGVDVPVATFIEKTKELAPDVLGVGAYMSTTMLLMKDVIAELQKAGLRDKVKVMVGGVPTSAEFAAEIGADIWGKDALDAVAKVKSALGIAAAS